MPTHVPHAEARKFLMTKEQRRIVKFALVGGSGVVVNQVVVWLVGSAMLGTLTGGTARSAALAAGILVSIFTNYVINDAWTWGDRLKGGPGDWLRRCGVFYVTNGVGAAIQWMVAATAARFLVFQGSVLGVDGALVGLQLASLIGIAVATPLNYVANHKLTFRDAPTGEVDAAP